MGTGAACHALGNSMVNATTTAVNNTASIITNTVSNVTITTANNIATFAVADTNNSIKYNATVNSTTTSNSNANHTNDSLSGSKAHNLNTVNELSCSSVTNVLSDTSLIAKNSESRSSQSLNSLSSNIVEELKCSSKTSVSSPLVVNISSKIDEDSSESLTFNEPQPLSLNDNVLLTSHITPQSEEKLSTKGSPIQRRKSPPHTIDPIIYTAENTLHSLENTALSTTKNAIDTTEITPDSIENTFQETNLTLNVTENTIAITRTMVHASPNDTPTTDDTVCEVRQTNTCQKVPVSNTTTKKQRSKRGGKRRYTLSVISACF